ncbi:MAG: hypothetical protein BWY60_00299 [Actinobacteria bacterium ADurb.Bin346]|nr:MAG: hypothetical protein BWY60_00299 [Actinobacteria bacterium ADurb.Bin346]
MCGCCLAGCEGNFDLPQLIESARVDIAGQGLEPEIIKQFKNYLMEKGNIYGLEPEKSFTFLNRNYKKDSAEILYIAGQSVNYGHHEIAEAAIDFFIKTKTDFTIIGDEPDCGKSLKLLGYKKEAGSAAEKFYEAMLSGKAKNLVTSDPLVLDCLINDFKEFGIEVEKSFKIMHFSEFADFVLNEFNLPVKEYDKKVAIADSEFLCKKNARCDSARAIVLKAAKNGYTEMFRNKKDAYATGEAAFYQNGAVFADGKALGKKIYADALKLGLDTIITLSGTAKENILAAGGKKIEVLDIAEFITSLLK